MAKNAGIRTMWDNEKGEAARPHPGQGCRDCTRRRSSTSLGYGAYPITVLDHANGLATIANRGMYNKAHFVLSVEKKDADTGKWRLVGGEDLNPRQTIRPEVADDVNDVLQEIPRNNGDSLDGRPATGKTGTWELNEKSADNAHAWMIGATPQLATAIWVGNVGKQVALIDDNGEKVQGSGLPAEIWKRFMDKALAGRTSSSSPKARASATRTPATASRRRRRRRRARRPTCSACSATGATTADGGNDNRGNDNRGGGNNNDDNTLFGDHRRRLRPTRTATARLDPPLTTTGAHTRRCGRRCRTWGRRPERRTHAPK